MVNANNEFDDKAEKRTGADRGNEDVTNALQAEVNKAPEAKETKETNAAIGEWGKSVKDGSCMEKTKALEALVNSPEYKEHINNLDEKELRELTEQSDQAVKFAKAIIASLGSRLMEVTSKV